MSDAWGEGTCYKHCHLNPESSVIPTFVHALHHPAVWKRGVQKVANENTITHTRLQVLLVLFHICKILIVKVNFASYYNRYIED